MILDVFVQLLACIDDCNVWELLVAKRAGPITLTDIVGFKHKRFKGSCGGRNRTGHWDNRLNRHRQSKWGGGRNGGRRC